MPDELLPKALELFDELIHRSPEERSRRLDWLRCDNPQLAAEVEAMLLADGAELPDLQELLGGGEQAELARLEAYGRVCGLSDTQVAGLMKLLEGWRRPSPTAATLPGVVSVDAQDTWDFPDRSYTGDLLAGRYEDLGVLGEGGMGEVRRVRDVQLRRTMAMKICRPEVLRHPSARARFIEEAQCSAQLQHPGIVPVHELGRLSDGRVYFTMKEVQGRTLGEVIQEVHSASPDASWESSRTGWNFRRLVDAFHKVCEAVGYAHERGVVHRDLKPENIMVARHGEVLVLDWGLAKVVGHRDFSADIAEVTPIETARMEDAAMATRMGMVAGTPMYMPPEQARGEIDRIGPASDVYALGAILYEILSDRPPYAGTSPAEVLQQVLSGPPTSPGRHTRVASTFNFELNPIESSTPAGPPLPEELVDACLRAMRRDPEQRFQNASQLAAEVGAWLEGARRRGQALEVVGQSARSAARASKLAEKAALLRQQGEALLEDIPAWAPEEQKWPGWRKLDEADEAEHEALLAKHRSGQLLNAALTHDATLAEAHGALAEEALAAHARAEDARDRRAAAQQELELRAHTESLPGDHPVALRVTQWLSGMGSLTLHTNPPGAEVELLRFEEQHRRQVAQPLRTLGRTPLVDLPLPIGSYLCVLRHPERHTVHYPVRIGRQERWDGVPPEGGPSLPVRLPGSTEIGPDECFVPAGWFTSGGPPGRGYALDKRLLWCDDFVLRRHPVTNREYLLFLNELVARGEEEEALRWVPREMGGREGARGAALYGRDEQGFFELVADAEGDLWLPDYPVVMIDWHAAVAYARWFAARTGQPWRLLHEMEWEKAARGVDGRSFPWGDHYDESRANGLHSRAGRPSPVEVHEFPMDCSVYGMRGAAGNVRVFCGGEFERDGCADRSRVSPPALPADDTPSPRTLRPDRGGIWYAPAIYAYCAGRNGIEAGARHATMGFRLGRSI